MGDKIRIETIYTSSAPSKEPTFSLPDNVEAEAVALMEKLKPGQSFIIYGVDPTKAKAALSALKRKHFVKAPTVFRAVGRTGRFFGSDNDFVVYVNRDLPRQVDYFVFFTLGQLYYWEGEYERALAALNQSIVAVEADVADTQPEGLAYAYFYRGNIYSTHRQDRLAAIADYRRALALAPSFAIAAFNLGGSLRIWANTLRAGGKEDSARRSYREAILAYGQATTLDPEYVPAYEGRALAYFEIERYGEAVADYEAVLARHPRAETCYQLGLALRNLKRWDEALAALNEALVRAPGVGRYYLGRGRILLRMGQEAQAAADFRAYLRLAPASDAERRNEDEAGAHKQEDRGEKFTFHREVFFRGSERKRRCERN